MKTYLVNEIFYSIQTEGARAGTANVFVRFAGCNLACNKLEHGFDCDTDFSSGREMTSEQLQAAINEADVGHSRNVIWTGGEPTLQLDSDLTGDMVEWFHAIETNGTKPVPEHVNFISVSPKTAEHTLVVERPNELRYVRAAGQAIPHPRLRALFNWISPAFGPSGVPNIDDLEWCIQLVKDNPEWRLSLQTHKLIKIR